MKITINTEVLQREGLSLGEFLTLLMGYYEQNYQECLDRLINKKIVLPNLFKKMSMVLSNNTKDYISKLLMESDDKVSSSNIDFTALAKKLQEIYPEGTKPGTTYSWRNNTDVIVQKLITIISRHNFTFTEQEAIQATKEYVNSFKEDNTKMLLLKNFILTTNTNSCELNSMFMTIIENNR